MKDTKLSLPIVILICLAIGGAAFYGGTLMNKKPAFANNPGQFAGMTGRNNNATGRAGMTGRAANSSMINGEILKIDDKSVTIKLNDGGSKIVYLSSDTIISKFTEAEKKDLEIGKSVTVSAKTDTSGNQTAQSIQLRPLNDKMMPGGNGRPNSQTTTSSGQTESAPAK